MPILPDCYGYDRYNCQALISHINISKMRSPVALRDTRGSTRQQAKIFHYLVFNVCSGTLRPLPFTDKKKILALMSGYPEVSLVLYKS